MNLSVENEFRAAMKLIWDAWWANSFDDIPWSKIKSIYLKGESSRQSWEFYNFMDWMQRFPPDIRFVDIGYSPLSPGTRGSQAYAAYRPDDGVLYIDKNSWANEPDLRVYALIESLGYVFDTHLNGLNDAKDREGAGFRGFVVESLGLNQPDKIIAFDPKYVDITIDGVQRRGVEEVLRYYDPKAVDGGNGRYDREIISSQVALGDSQKLDGIAYVKFYQRATGAEPGGDLNLPYENQPINTATTGTGIYIGDGYLVTAQHVIGDRNGRVGNKYVGAAFFGLTADSAGTAHSAWNGLIEDAWLRPGKDLAIVRLSDWSKIPASLSVWDCVSPGRTGLIDFNLDGSSYTALKDDEAKYSIYGYGAGQPAQLDLGGDIGKIIGGKHSVVTLAGTKPTSQQALVRYGRPFREDYVSIDRPTHPDESTTTHTENYYSYRQRLMMPPRPKYPYYNYELADFYFKDIEVYHGDSGGPVVGVDGKVYGLITQAQPTTPYMFDDDDIQWMKFVKSGLVMPHKLDPKNDSRPDISLLTASYVFHDEVDLGFQEYHYPEGTPNLLTIESKGDKLLFKASLRLVNISSVPIHEPLTISIVCRRRNQDPFISKTGYASDKIELYRYTFQSLPNPSLRSSTVVDLSFELDPLLLPDFSRRAEEESSIGFGTQAFDADPRLDIGPLLHSYSFWALLDPDNLIREIDATPNYSFLGTGYIEQPPDHYSAFKVVQSLQDNLTLMLGATGYLIRKDNGVLIPITWQNGIPAKQDSPGSGWTAFAILRSSTQPGNYTLYWRNRREYKLWNLDSNGVLLSSSEITYKDFLSLESLSRRDLDLDGGVGNLFTGDFSPVYTKRSTYPGIIYGKTPLGFAIKEENKAVVNLTLRGQFMHETSGAGGAGEFRWEVLGVGKSSANDGFSLISQFYTSSVGPSPNLRRYMWNVDVNGAVKHSSMLSERSFLRQESVMDYDLDGDSRVGFRIVMPSELYSWDENFVFPDYNLVSTADGYGIRGKLGFTTNITWNHGQPVSQDNPGAGWRAKSLFPRELGGGYDLYWKNDGYLARSSLSQSRLRVQQKLANGMYSRWRLDGAGAFVDGEILSLQDLRLEELKKSRDLDMDGRLGPFYKLVYGDNRPDKYTGEPDSVLFNFSTVQTTLGSSSFSGQGFNQINALIGGRADNVYVINNGDSSIVADYGNSANDILAFVGIRYDAATTIINTLESGRHLSVNDAIMGSHVVVYDWLGAATKIEKYVFTGGGNVEVSADQLRSRVQSSADLSWEQWFATYSYQGTLSSSGLNNSAGMDALFSCYEQFALQRQETVIP